MHYLSILKALLYRGKQSYQDKWWIKGFKMDIALKGQKHFTECKATSTKHASQGWGILQILGVQGVLSATACTES